MIHSRTLYSEYYNALVPRLAVELQLLQKSTLTARRDQFGPRRKLCSENVKNILLFFFISFPESAGEKYIPVEGLTAKALL